MDKQTRDKWLDSSLYVLFEAFAKDDIIRDLLTFKGARILKYHLKTMNRFSMDIDSSLSFEFVSTYKFKTEQTAYLEDALTKAITKYFLTQDTIKYRLENLRIKANPPNDNHPYGWDGFKVIVNLSDIAYRTTRGLPRIGGIQKKLQNRLF